MGYNPQNAKEQATMPADTIVEGAITHIQDGIVKDMVSNLKDWKGDTNSPAIEITVEVKYDKKVFNFNQLFPYTDKDGQTIFSGRSNLGKYKKKYDKLPEVGDIVKGISNSDGFLKLKLD